MQRHGLTAVPPRFEQVRRQDLALVAVDAEAELAAAWLANFCAAVAVVALVDEDKNTCEVS